MKKLATLLFTFFMLFGFLGSVQGQTTLVEYIFTGNSATASTVETGLNASSFSISSGSVSYGTAQSGDWTGSGVPYAEGSGGWTASEFSSGKYFTFTLSLDGADSFDLTNISFLHRATGAGPSALTVTINGTEIQTINVADSETIELSEALNLTELTNAEIRIIGWDNESRSTSGGGAFRLDDVKLTGSAEVTTPVLSASESSLDFDYVEDSGPSDSQSFDLSGTNMDGSNVTVSAPSNFEIAETEGGAYGSSLTYNSYDGSSETIWVRLEAGLAVNEYSGNVNITGGGADAINVAVTGQVDPDYEFVETFETENFSPGGSYGDGSFEGVTGVTWTYVASRDDAGYPINGDNAVLLRRSSDNSSLTSDVISGGIKEFSVLFRKSFTGSGNRQIELFIGPDTENLESYGTSEAFDVDGEIRRFTVSDINYVGDFVLRISNVTSSQVNIDDVSWDSYDNGEFQITGNAGWRMLSFPITGGTVADISDDTAIQGVTGGDNAEAASNFLIYKTGTDSEDFTAPADVNTAFGDGFGFITYFYNNTNAGSSELPLTLAVSGEEPSSDVTVTLNTESNYTLVGNPFASNFDLSAITTNTGAIQNDVHFWDNSSGGGLSSFETVDRTGADNIVGTWQGFWVENNGADDITFPTSGKTTDAADVSFSKENSNKADIAFTLSSENSFDKAIRMSFRENAELGWDVADASKFVPLTNAHATMAFVGEEKLQSVFSLPYNLEEEFEVKLKETLVGVSGEFTFAWEGIESLPAEWNVTLHDYETGVSINMRDVGNYVFEAEATIKAKEGKNALIPELTAMKKTEESGRFGIVVNAETPVSSEPVSAPEQFTLNQNYPNPFNPATNIKYSVPEAGAVSLNVYNVMGQHVATLVNETKSAGTYQVTWDAANMASGIYYYRLQAGNTVLTRQMTLIK